MEGRKNNLEFSGEDIVEQLTATELREEFAVSLRTLADHFEKSAAEVSDLMALGKIPKSGLAVNGVVGAVSAIKKLKALGRELTGKIGAAHDDILEKMEKNRLVMQKVREKKKTTTKKKRG